MEPEPDGEIRNAPEPGWRRQALSVIGAAAVLLSALAAGLLVLQG